MEEVGAGIAFTLLFVAILAITFGGLAFWVVALIDVVKLPEHAYRMAGKEKVTWVLVVALASWVGALIWWFGPRKEVRAAFAAAPNPPPMYLSGPPPGWYPDPSGQPGLVWWDGSRWTTHRQ